MSWAQWATLIAAMFGGAPGIVTMADRIRAWRREKAAERSALDAPWRLDAEPTGPDGHLLIRARYRTVGTPRLHLRSVRVMQPTGVELADMTAVTDDLGNLKFYEPEPDGWSPELSVDADLAPASRHTGGGTHRSDEARVACLARCRRGWPPQGSPLRVRLELEDVTATRTRRFQDIGTPHVRWPSRIG